MHFRSCTNWVVDRTVIPQGVPPTFGSGRSKDEPTASATRKFWLLVELLRDGYVRVDDYLRRYGTDKRTLQRDLHQLRAIGKELRFSITAIKDGQIRLSGFDRRPRRLGDERAGLLRLIAEFGRSFGAPVQEQLEPLAGTSTAGDSFLQIHEPALVAGSKVGQIFRSLHDAATAPDGPCYVRFRYRAARGASLERTVEPHHVVVRAGRYYLVGYDQGRRAWRIFALDAIEGIPTRAGTINTPHAVPTDYVSDDVLGFIKDDVSHIEVTVELKANVVASVTSRLWQRDQRVEMLPDGGARITFSVSNLAEVVRWAFGFAPDASIIAPPQAVDLSRQMASQLR